MDEALQAFWYRDLLRATVLTEADAVDAIEMGIRPEIEAEWGIHVNADALVEFSAGIATGMERDGVPNASDLALDLCFIFGFDHCFFHHMVDAQVSLHTLRLSAAGAPAPNLRAAHRERSERLHRARAMPQWFFEIEEALANAHVARDPSRLGGLNQAFMQYGLLPQPLDAARGPWSMWEQAAMDERAFNALSHMLWLQHLTGEMDPLGVLPEMEIWADEGGLDAALARFIDLVMEAAQPQHLDGELPMDGGRPEDWVEDLAGEPHLMALGGFSNGLLRRLKVPIWFHGGHGPELERRYDSNNGDWPYGTIERLYAHFRTDAVGAGSDDPFEAYDDDFDLTP